jgi:thioredoxin reductase
MYDVIIVGAGPAGLTAATNTAHRGLQTLVIEQYEKAGGQPLIVYPDKIVKDHPGFPIGVLAKEFARMLQMQATNAGAEIHLNEEALLITKRKEGFLELKTTDSVYLAKRIILCTGMLNVPNRPPILKDFDGTGIHYKLGDASRFKGKRVIVIGGGDNAFDTALQLAEVTDDVKILVKQGYAKAKESTVKEAEGRGITVRYNSEIIGLGKKGRALARVKVADLKTGAASEIELDTLFSAIGFSSHNEFLKNNGLEQRRDGSIKVGKNYETSMAGVFAAGDVTGEVKLIAVACAEGIEAAISAFSSIKKPYWLH